MFPLLKVPLDVARLAHRVGLLDQLPIRSPGAARLLGAEPVARHDEHGESGLAQALLGPFQTGVLGVGPHCGAR